MALDIATTYGLIFMNKNKTWLTCYRSVNLVRCRCLDELELNIAMLWLGNPSQSNKILLCPSTPYTVGVQRSKPTNNLFNGISWCNPNDDLKFVEHHSISNTVSNIFFEKWYLMDGGIELLFSLLCLYKVNTQPCRKKIVEYYFLTDWGSFCKYVGELSKYLKSTSGSNEWLKEHLLLLQDVILWYNGKTDVTKGLKDYLEDTIYSTVRNNIDDSSTPNIDFILNSLNNKLNEMFCRETAYIDMKLVDSISNIARATKGNDESLWQECKTVFENIYNSLNEITSQTLRGGEGLNNSLDSLKDIIFR